MCIFFLTDVKVVYLSSLNLRTLLLQGARCSSFNAVTWTFLERLPILPPSLLCQEGRSPRNPIVRYVGARRTIGLGREDWSQRLMARVPHQGCLGELAMRPAVVLWVPWWAQVLGQRCCKLRAAMFSWEPLLPSSLQLNHTSGPSATLFI